MQVHDSDATLACHIVRFAAIATSCGSTTPWQSLNRLPIGYITESDISAMSAHRTVDGHAYYMPKLAQVASTHRQHQVCWQGCRFSVMFTCHYVQTPVEPIYRSGHRSIEGQASQQCVRDEHTQTRYSRSFVVRGSRWSAHRWLNELNADCAISNR